MSIVIPVPVKDIWTFVKNHWVKLLIGLFGFFLGFMVYPWYATGNFTNIPIIPNNTEVVFLDLNSDKKTNFKSKLNSIENEISSEFEPPNEDLTVRDQYIHALVELDILTGKMQILDKVTQKGDINQLLDDILLEYKIQEEKVNAIENIIIQNN